MTCPSTPPDRSSVIGGGEEKERTHRTQFTLPVWPCRVVTTLVGPHPSYCKTHKTVISGLVIQMCIGTVCIIILSVPFCYRFTVPFLRVLLFCHRFAPFATVRRTRVFFIYAGLANRNIHDIITCIVQDIINFMSKISNSIHKKSCGITSKRFR